MRQPPHFRIKIKSFLGFCYHFLSNAGSGDGGAHQRNAADVVFSADVVFTDIRSSGGGGGGSSSTGILWIAYWQQVKCGINLEMAFPY